MKISNKAEDLSIKLTTLEKIFSLHGDFTIPKNKIKSIKKGHPKQTIFELKIPGTYLPLVIKAGTFVNKRGREFWLVNRNSPNIYTIELKDSYYKRLVLGLKNGAPDISAINR